LSTYHKYKKGFIHPLLVFVDLIILVIPFSTIFVVFLVNYIFDDVQKQ